MLELKYKLETEKWKEETVQYFLCTVSLAQEKQSAFLAKFDHWLQVVCPMIRVHKKIKLKT